MFRAMDPSTLIDWQWFNALHRPTQIRVACILWTLYEHGPVVDEAGNAPSKLGEVLRQRRGPYQATGAQPTVRQLLVSINRGCPDLIERDVNVSRTRRLALRPDAGPADLPPNPYDEEGPAPRAPAAAEESASGTPPAMSAPDALAAIASFVASAMRMAGVTDHDTTADERLEDAMAECRRLQDLLDAQGEQLLVKMREAEVLRRALAQRDGRVKVR
jgi:hypothetical protein